MKFGIVCFFISFIGCKAANWDKVTSQNRQASAMLEPQLVASTDLADIKTPVAFDLDSESGRTKSVLTLRLDYFPKTEGDESALPVCLSPLGGKFVVGRAECLDAPGLAKDIYAENVDQSCYTDDTIPRTRATVPFALVGCSRAIAAAHRFEPTLLLDVEMR